MHWPSDIGLLTVLVAVIGFPAISYIHRIGKVLDAQTKLSIRAMAFPRVLRDLKSAEKEIETLRSRLAEYESSELPLGVRSGYRCEISLSVAFAGRTLDGPRRLRLATDRAWIGMLGFRPRY